MTVSLTYPVTACEKAYQWVEAAVHHSDLITSIAILALNSAKLATYLVPALPRTLGRSSQVTLSTIGVLSINVQARTFKKTLADGYVAVRLRDPLPMLLMAAKVANEASNIGLTALGFLAATSALVCCPWGAALLYGIMAPWGVVATFIAAGLDGCNAHFSRRLVRDLSRMEGDDDKIKVFFEKSAVPSRLFATVVRGLDPDTWEILKTELPKAESPLERRRLFKVVLAYSVKQQEVATADIGLRTLGYLSMAICRAFPDTVIQSSIYTTMSLIHTSKLLFEKLFQHAARTSMQEIR